MTTPWKVECGVHFGSQGRSSRKTLEIGPQPYCPAEPGRLPRVARLMALAIRCDGLLRDRVLESYMEIGRLGHASRARVSQIMNLLHLAPDILEALLFLPRTQQGRDVLQLRLLQPIAVVADGKEQRTRWRELIRAAGV